MIRQSDMRNVELLINARFESLPEELKNSPKALLEWAMTNIFQQISYMQENNGSVDFSQAVRADHVDVLEEVIRQNPQATGHQIIDSAPR